MHEVDCAQEHADYEAMFCCGLAPEFAYREALRAGLGRIRGIRMLRAVYSLSLEEASTIGEERSATGMAPRE